MVLYGALNDPVQVYDDILKTYQQLNLRLAGNLTLETPMTLVLPTSRQQCLLYANHYRTTMRDLLRENLPEAGSINLAPGAEETTILQLFAHNINGQDVVTTAFTEKLRAYIMECYSSYLQQKKSQST